MDALEELRQMHADAKAAFKRIDEASPSERGALWATLRRELELHEQIEERFVYRPVARDIGVTDPVLVGWENHHESDVRVAELVMAKISALRDTSGAPWLELVQALRATLEAHMTHEEGDIWPRIRTAWGNDRLRAAGWPIAAAKAAALGGNSVAAAIKAGDEAAKASSGHA